MKKQFVDVIFFRYEGKPIQAKRDLSYEMKLQARLTLDEICFKYNKVQLEKKIETALVEGNKAQFKKYSEAYKEYIWE